MHFRPADNPVGAMARRLHLGSGHVAPRLSLPGKLVFPSSHTSGHFSMLGLGDIVMPGLLLCFVMRYDAYKKAQVAKHSTPNLPLPYLAKPNLGS
jgi:signal peptide peptidase-like protein 3